jgi:glucose/arabinose dehydrogenase/PKD repeat protein
LHVSRRTAPHGTIRHRRPSALDRALSQTIEQLEPRRLLAAVTATAPFNGQTQFALASNLTVTFDLAMNTSTFTSSTVQLRDYNNNPVAASLSYNATTKQLTIDPVNDLVSNSGYYFVRLVGGASGVKDTAGGTLAKDYTFSFTTSTPNFAEQTVLSGLNAPVAVEFANDGSVYVAERRGVIKKFDSLNATTATTVFDNRTATHNYWDRGLLGLALHPNFPTVPEVYILYTYDGSIGGTAPTYGTAGADSDGGGADPTGAGSFVSARLSRLTLLPNGQLGNEQVLVHDWNQQYPSHSIGHLQFGPDGYLYASAGDGASFNFVDYGQYAVPWTGDDLKEGGAVRSQDVLDTDDPVGLDGTVIRINPRDGSPAPNNPYAARADVNAQRILANGLRNPFRFTFRPGTSELWIGDVGWNDWEEINRITNVGGGAKTNFGWPAYEGNGQQSGYKAQSIPLLQQLWTTPSLVTQPYFTYKHSDKVVAGSAEPTGGSSTTGLAFYTQGSYPIAFNDALFFDDYSRKQIYVMYRGPDGNPLTSSRQVFRATTNGAVELQIGPGGDLFYVDMNGGRIQRVISSGGNRAPTAVATANVTTGPAPLTVQFDGRASSDPDPGDVLSYSWDLNGDGVFGDSALANPSYTYTVGGSYAAKLRVTDRAGVYSDSATITINAGSTAPVPVISAPATTLRWTVGDTINFAGSASDLEDGNLPASALKWDLVLVHGNEIDPTNTHEHYLQSFVGVASGSFKAPDHEYPSWLELRLTATDSAGRTATVVQRVDPKVVQLTLASTPTGAQLGQGSEVYVAPVVRSLIAGGRTTLTAVSPQIINGLSYVFDRWSDGGAQAHDVVAGANATYTATYVRLDPPGIPSNLAAVATSSTSVRLTWTDTSTVEDGVEVQVLSNGSWLTVATLPPNTTSFDHTNLLGATTYTYRVRSFNRAGTSAGDPVSVTTLAGARVPYLGTPISVPGKVEAEYFDKGGTSVGYFDLTPGNEGGVLRPSEDVDIEGSADVGGGANVGWFVAGEWMTYTLNVTQAGLYTVSTRVASVADGGSFHIEFDGVDKTGPITVPNTGGWQTWRDVAKANISLPAGTVVMKVVADSNNGWGFAGNFNYFTLSAGSQSAPAAPSNLVATSTNATQATLTWTDRSTDETSFKVERKLGLNGTWQAVAVVPADTAGYLDTGLVGSTTYYYRVRATNGAGDSAASNEAFTTTADAAQSPFGGTAWPIANPIQFENFDVGGPGVAYLDATPGNEGGAYRNENVDIEVTGDAGGGYNVGWASAGEWLEYTIDVPAAGTYRLDTRLASPISGGRFHYEVDNVDVTGPVSVPATGAWQAYQTVSVPGIYLSPGTHTVRFSLDQNNGWGWTANFNWFQFVPQQTDPAANGDGLTAQYWNNIDYTGTSVTKVDRRVDFDWGEGKPDPAIDPDTFSVRWTGQFLAQKTETYTFYVRSDDGARLWVNGKLLVDQWRDHEPLEYSGTVALTAGQKYDVRLDYYENLIGAVAELRYSTPTTPKQIVPQSLLFSTGYTGGSTLAGLKSRTVSGTTVNPLNQPVRGYFSNTPLDADSIPRVATAVLA